MIRFAFVARLLVACLLAASAGLAAQVPGAGSATASGGIKTADIAQATVSAAPSCLRYTLRGGCVWLRCDYFPVVKCNVRVTIRVQHMQPDLTISTWHDYTSHPWTDYGRAVANGLQSAGSSLMGSSPVGAASTLLGSVDVSGTRAAPQTRNSNAPQRAGHNMIYRGADVIGNPANFISCIANNDCNPATPSSVPIPMPDELVRFFTDWPQQVIDQWAEIPAGFSSDEIAYAAQQTGVSSEVITKAASVVSAYRNYAGSLPSSGSYWNSSSGGPSLNLGSAGGASGGSGPGGGQGSGSPIGTNTGSNEYFCPAGVIPFGLLMHSELDAWFWRGVVPLESIYPATWLPGFHEVGGGFVNTWGSVFPRQGTVFQQHPVKASAVLAQRAGDFVTKKAQPHIYTVVDMYKQGWRWFGDQSIREHNEAQTIWQRVYPNAESSCHIFGSNDSLSLTSFGDANVAPAEGYIWNAWRRQECCYAPAGYTFIGSVAI